MRERLDRFLVSTSWLRKTPFLSSVVIRQANSDHDAIVLDTLGRKPIESSLDARLKFRFKECWSKDRGAKDTIKEAWSNNSSDILEKIGATQVKLGSWQRNKYNDSKRRMRRLMREIDDIIDGHITIIVLTRCGTKEMS